MARAARRPDSSAAEASDRVGFFIPYRYAVAARATGYPALRPWLVAAEPRMREILREIAARLPRIVDGAPPPAPRWEQDWFPRLDAAAAYAIVQTVRPARIVEVGSGHSTRFLAKAIRDASLATRLLCIDPAPRARIDSLGIEHLAEALGDQHAALVVGLRAGDILFVDSSHIAMPGTDVDLVIGTLLPRLAPGVLVHFHDIFLPDAYPRGWAWRGYNEQIAVAALLQGGGYAIEHSSRWLATRRRRWLQAAGLDAMPLRRGVRESSLWLVKRA
jgi:hypothetical protein